MDMVRVRVASCLVCCHKLKTDELVNATLGIYCAQEFDLNIDLHLVDVDDAALPIINLVMLNVMHHCCLVYY
jgi:hypothetical protein